MALPDYIGEEEPQGEHSGRIDRRLPERPDLRVVKGGGQGKTNPGERAAQKQVMSGKNYKSPRLQRLQQFTFKHRRKLIAGGLGGGTIAGLLFAVSLFLPALKLEHLFANIEDKRFAQEIYSYGQRSDAWMRTYLEARAADGSSDGHNYFKAKNVDTNHPFVDWYKTLRTSNFEQMMAERQGIVFVNETKTGRLVKLKIQDKTLFDFSSLQGSLDQGLTPDKLDKIGLKLGQTYGTNREARIAIKEAVKSDTHFWQIVKRSHIRHWMANVLGVTKWKVFEKTHASAKDWIRARYATYILTPVKDKIGGWVECVLKPGSKSCPYSTDPNEEAKATEGTARPATQDENQTQLCAQNQSASDCQKIQDKLNTQLNEGSTSDQITQAIDNANNQLTAPECPVCGPAESEVAAATAKEADAKIVPANLWEALLGETIGSKIFLAANIVQIFDMLDHADKAIRGNLIGKIVSVRNAMQYAGEFTAFAITVDQLKSGQDVQPDQVNAVMEKFNGIEQSQGYADVFNQPNSSKNVQVEEGDKVNDGNFQKFADGYSSSALGQIFNVVLSAYDTIRHAPIVSTIFDFISGIFSQIGTIVIHAVLSVVKAITGFDAMKAIAGLMEHLMSFAFGAVVDGSETRGKLFNAIDAGGSVTASAYMHSVGGHLLSPQQAFANTEQLAADTKMAESQKSVWNQIASLEDSNSLASRLVVQLPGSRQELFASLGGYFTKFIANPMASIFNPRLAMAVTGTGHAITVPGENLYGVKTYGFTAQELSVNPLDLTPAYCAQLENSNQQILDAARKQSQADISNNAFDEASNNISDMCAFDQTFAQASKAEFTTADDGGLGNSPVTPDNGSGGQPASGTVAQLAQKILDSGNVTYSGRDVQKDLQLTSQGLKGTAGAYVSTPLLQLIATLARNHTLDVSAIESGGTGHTTGSAHYSGDAIDIDRYDSSTFNVNGRDTASLEIIRIAVTILPGGGFGQSGCQGHGPLQLPQGFDEFGDACTHLHIQVPPGTP